jgi:biotin carboxylase
MNSEKEKNIILFVNQVSEGTINEVREYGKKKKQDFQIAVIVDNKNTAAKKDIKDLDIDIELFCDLSSDIKIMRTLLPYQEDLLAITCRGEKNIPDFSKIIPHVPYLKTPTQKSLDWSIEKIMMRKRFSSYDKKITPKHCIVSDYSKKTLEAIKERVGFPLVVKPSNLASSLMISICFYEEELEETLKVAFKKIKKIYKDNGRKKEPQLLVEQFMEGSMYSIDAYVNSRGKIYFCPLVKVKTGRQIGFDDFFGYQRLTPTQLNKPSIEKAHEVTREGIHALGLRSTTAHVELMRTEEGWKVIEIGPRIGGYREMMYKLSFGINHGVNDILIRVPQKPVIPKKAKGHTAVLQFFADKEGKLKSLKGIKKIKELESCFELKVNKKPGVICKYAKNGGKCVCDLIMFNEDRSKLLADIRRAEKALKIET